MSFQMTVLRTLVRAANARNLAASSLLKPARNTGVFDRMRINRTINVQQTSIEGFRVTSLIPQKPHGTHVVFFHGGSYTLEALPVHRRIAERLCMQYGFTVSVPEYPLTPENTHDDTFRYLTKAYRQLLATYPNENFYFFGDSAGGGLALTFLQQVSLSGDLPVPARTVLLSPWLDLSMSNPEIEYYEKKDPVLPKKALLHSAKNYAGSVDLNDPSVSPLFGPTNDLGKILLLFGTHEMFYPDCVLLRDKLEMATGTQVQASVYEGAIHDWILFPVPEARKAIKQFSTWLHEP